MGNVEKRRGLVAFRKPASAGVRIPVIALCLLLAACTPKVIHGCVPVPVWSEAEALALADELDALPPEYPMIERAVVEYGAMREMARACR